MGNCFSLGRSPSFFSSSASSSSRLNSLCSVSSCDSCPAIASLSAKEAAPKRILPFPTLPDLGAHYELGPELGRGRFGVVCHCTCRASGTHFACKSISKLICVEHLQDIVHEVRIMRTLSKLPSPEGDCTVDAVRLHQVIEDATHVHLIMDLCKGSELFDHIVEKKCCTEARAAAIMMSLMQTIEVCHGMGIMHRDIKPENILLVDDSESSPIRLADFGLALEFSPGEKFSGMAGSAYYIAPEVLQGEYSEEIDVWSAGVVLYVMLSGAPPFSGETDHDIFEAIRKGNLEFSGDRWRSISFSAQDLITKMLCPDVRARLTPAQVLEHPWILQLQHTNAPKLNVEPRCNKSMGLNDASALMPHEMVAQCMSGVLTPIPFNDIEQDKAARVLAAETPSFTPPPVNKDQHTVLCSKTSSIIGNHAVQALHIGTNGKTDIDVLLAPLVTKLDVKCFPMLEKSVDFSVKDGLVRKCAMENIFAVEAGKESYLISYNARKIFGWKISGQQHKGVPSNVHVTTPPQPLVSQ